VLRLARTLLGIVLLALAAPAAGHHAAGQGDGALALTLVDRQLAFHHRTDALEVWGRITPPSAAEGDEVSVVFQARRRGEPYAGAARVALTDRRGRRQEGALAPPVAGTFSARLRADLPDGDAILVQLPGAGVVQVPYEVRGRLAGTAYLLLALILVAAGALLALLARAARPPPETRRGGPIDTRRCVD
jgi:hypothetical protein